jgi:hypothetical protein
MKNPSPDGRQFVHKGGANVSVLSYLPNFEIACAGCLKGHPQVQFLLGVSMN